MAAPQLPATLPESTRALLQGTPAQRLAGNYGVGNVDITTARDMAKHTGFQRALTNAYTAMYAARFLEHPEELEEIDPALAAFLKTQGSNEPSKRCKYLHVTLNFPPLAPGESMLNFASTVLGLLGKQPAFVKRWIGVFEYYTAKGVHPHVHMLIEKTDDHMEKSPAQVAQDYVRKFERKTGLNKHAVNVKNYQDPTPVMSYVMGTKVDAEKMQNIAKDREFRELYGIPHVLGHWEDASTDPVLVNAPSTTD